MIITEKRIAELERIPRGYGIAWHEPGTFSAVCLPIPFNRIIGAFRAWWLEWRRPVENDPIIAAYLKGYKDRDARPLGDREYQWTLNILLKRLDASIAKKWKDAGL